LKLKYWTFPLPLLVADETIAARELGSCGAKQGARQAHIPLSSRQ